MTNFNCVSSFFRFYADFWILLSLCVTSQVLLGMLRKIGFSHLCFTVILCQKESKAGGVWLSEMETNLKREDPGLWPPPPMIEQLFPLLFIHFIPWLLGMICRNHIRGNRKGQMPGLVFSMAVTISLSHTLSNLNSFCFYISSFLSYHDICYTMLTHDICFYWHTHFLLTYILHNIDALSGPEQQGLGLNLGV